MKNSRISTGIPGLDEILYGGFKPASSYLIVGGPGTGKTVLSLQFLNESVKRNAKCLLITFAEPEASLRRSAELFGWDISSVAFEDFTQIGGENGTAGEYSVFSPGEVESTPIWKRIYDALDRQDAECLVIDSVTFLRYLSTDEYQFRKHIQRLVNHLVQRQCLSLLLFDPTELNKENAMALAVDGVIVLTNEVSKNRVVEIRSLEVRKTRASSYMPGRHPYRITGRGLTIWPHRIEKLKKLAYDRKILTSGIDSLDKMLGGGVPSGTCTLVTGPTGVGKSSLGTQFLATAASRGLKSVIYTFEEGSASIMERCKAISIPLADRMEDGSMAVRDVNPLELYPDEFLQVLRDDVENNGVEIIMLDSLRGYNLAMEQFGNLIAHIQNIVNYIRSKKASIFLIYEQERLTGDLQLSELGVSYLADNVILVRFAEYNGEVLRVINCLKKRQGSFQPELRKFQIDENGITVGRKLGRLQGLLTGVPRSMDEERSSEA
jgi:circadian clock protein KaiC